MSRIASISERILASPLLWGGLAWLAIYAMLTSGSVSSPLLDRYLLGHPIEKVTAFLFCVAVAALVIRSLLFIREFVALEQVVIEKPTPGGVSTAEAPRYLAQLDECPSLLRNSYIYRRLRDALDYVFKKDSAETLERQLRHLETVDIERLSSNYAVPRLMMWAIPVLGFLGTVIGISAAIGKLNPAEIETSIDAVVADLGLAFDTTALSLAFSIVIGLIKFPVERFESSLLLKVDDRVAAEMVGRFHAYGTSSDPHVASVRRMAEQVVRAVERMATEQAAVLRDTISEGHDHWVEVAKSTGRILDNALSTTLHDNLERHAQTLSNGVDRNLTNLRSTLESHVALLNAGAEKQVTMLTDGVNRSSDLVTEQLAQLAEQTREQLAELAQAATAHQSEFKHSVEEHSQQLMENSSDLIAKLRGGLEKMAELLVEALHSHGQSLAANEQQLATENRKHLVEVEAALGEAMVVNADRQEKLVERSEKVLAEIQQALSSVTSASVENHRELSKQSELLLKVVDAAGNVQSLERSLNENLDSLGRAHNFEETLLSLSAAIQLLSARVGHDGKRGTDHPHHDRAA